MKFLNSAVINGLLTGTQAQAVLAADQTNTLTTAANVAGLSFAIGANEVWIFDFILRIGSSSTTGCKYAITTPAGATLMAIVFGNTTAITAFNEEILTASGTLTAAVYQAIATQNGMLRISGVVRNGATAGTVQLQQAKVTSGTATVGANSSLMARRAA
jgi:hypothetical protein